MTAPKFSKQGIGLAGTLRWSVLYSFLATVLTLAYGWKTSVDNAIAESRSNLVSIKNDVQRVEQKLDQVSIRIDNVLQSWRTRVADFNGGTP